MLLQKGEIGLHGICGAREVRQRMGVGSSMCCACSPGLLSNLE